MDMRFCRLGKLSIRPKYGPNVQSIFVYHMCSGWKMKLWPECQRLPNAGTSLISPTFSVFSIVYYTLSAFLNDFEIGGLGA